MADQKITPDKPRNNPLSGKIPLIVAGVILAATIFSSVYTVDANERAVVTRFGRYQSTEEAGLQWKLPFGIDSVTKVTQKEFSEQFGFRTLQAGVSTTYDERDYSKESEMLTGDLNIVDVTWIIEYRIVDPRAWLFNVDNSRVPGTREDNRIKTIRDVTQAAMNQLVGDRAILDVMSTEKDNIQFQAQETIQEILDMYDLGVKVSKVLMQNVVPPKGEVQVAFEDVNTATQDRERAINEGNQAYNEEIPRLKGEARQLEAEAEGYRQARVNNANAEVALFEAILDEYGRSRDVTRDRLYYETLAKVFANTDNTTLIDKNLENFLPLKDLTGGGE